MKRKPWLRLVPRGDAGGRPEDEAPPGAALEGDAGGGAPEDAAFSEALRAAWSGAGALSEADHEAILARALGLDPAEAAATEAEAEGAERLRRLLEGAGDAGDPRGSDAAGDDAGELAELALALRAAARPGELAAASNEARIAQALGAAAGKKGKPDEVRRAGSRVVALGGLLALAAAVALLLRFGPPGFGQGGSAAHAPRIVPAAPRVAARSTEALFDPSEPFPRRGGHASRIDRIASARTAELRANRFAAWGVR